MPQPNKNDLPSTPRLEYVLAAPDVQLIRDLLGGTRVMQLKHRTYISKYPSEPQQRFKTRAQTATVYGGLSRALSAATGMLFAEPPERQDTWSPQMEEHAENIDCKGTRLEVFAKRRAFDSLSDGLCGILIDHPKAPADVVVTEANENELNLRPKWSGYARADILSWLTDVVNNAETLVQVVLREAVGQRDGRFGIKPVLQYRVCYLTTRAGENGPEFGARWELLREIKKDGQQEPVATRVDFGEFRDRKGVLFQQIPLAILYAGRTDAILTADPPLLDMAYANLEHWQIATELRWYEKLAAHPQPTIEGELQSAGMVSTDGSMVKPALTLGPTTVVNLTAGSKFSYTEVSGVGFDGLRKSKEEKRIEMSELGASFLFKQTRGVETAEAKRLDAQAENSTLATAGIGIEDGLNQALMFHAQYLGIEAKQAPVLHINTDFEMELMGSDVMGAYATLVDKGFPKRVALEMLQMGGRISEDENLETLEGEWESGLQAALDAKAEEAAANALANPLMSAGAA